MSKFLEKLGGVAKGVAGSGMLGPVAGLASKLFKEGGKIKKRKAKKAVGKAVPKGAKTPGKQKQSGTNLFPNTLMKKGGRVRNMFTEQYD